MRRTFLLVLICFITYSLDAQIRRRATVPSQQPAQSQSDVSNYAQPKEYVIASIEVEGLRVLDKNALISLTGLKVGDKIKVPGDKASNALRKLWKYGLIGDAGLRIDKIEGENIYLTFILNERPRLTGFSFEGVKQAKEADLREDLNLIRGKIISDAVVRNTETTVRNYFIEKGFLNTDVKVVQEEDTINTDGVRLKIVVDTKAKVRIDNIVFAGNDNLPSSKLKSKMKSTKERARVSIFKRGFETVFGITPKKAVEFVDSTYEVSGADMKEFINQNVKLNFFKSSKFIKSDFDEDKKMVIDYYNSQGYRDAQIVSDSIYATSDNTVNVLLNVDEGNKYYFRDIDWTGNFVYTDEQLDRVLGINKGEVYNMELIDKKLTFNPNGADISGMYYDNGYLIFSITPNEVAVEGDSIDIEMRIFEGDQFTIKNVIIKGNDRTRDHVVRRELFTVPGRKFSRADIIRTNQALASLGYFDPEQISPTPIPNPQDGTVDIEWSVVERSSDQIELSGGFGAQFGFIGTLGLVLNNFSLRNMMKGKFTPVPVGDGQRLAIRAQANGRQFQNYSFSFTEPWLGGRKPNSFSISYNYSVQRARVVDFDQSGSEFFPPFDQFNARLGVQGVTVGLGRRLRWPDNYFQLTNSVSYLQYTLENYGTRGLGFSDGPANSFTFNITLARNSIDNPMYPTSGSSLSLSASFTPPYSLFKEDEFWTTSPEQREEIRDEVETNFPNASDLFLRSQYNAEVRNVENAEKYKWIEYHKWMFDAKFYMSVIGKLVVEAKMHFGFIGSYNKSLGVGPFERFYLGGDGLSGNNFLLGTDIIGLRGYENNTITPPNYGLAVSEFTQNTIDGGTVYNKFGVELRYPVTTGQAATIYGFLFAEGGNNWNTFNKFNPFDLYRSAGFGARIFMPAFGLIGISWGYGFDVLPGRTETTGGLFQFTIGQQIR
jgi:outer membrane protein insertion porin family